EISVRDGLIVAGLTKVRPCNRIVVDLSPPVTLSGLDLCRTVASPERCDLRDVRGLVMPTGRRTALARRRRALGMSQELLAIRLGVDVKSVARWESGASEPQPW